MTLLRLFCLAGGAAIVVTTLPLVTELGVLSVAALLPQRRRKDVPGSAFSVAVVIPAHNEEQLVAACVRSVLLDDPQAAVYVVAHNCSDKTASEAMAAGARALVLDDPAERGKGAALRHGFARALADGADAVLVIDADSVVCPGLLAECRAAFAAGAHATQCRYTVAAGAANPRAGLLALAFLGINVVRPRGRDGLGLSCGIFGNGFAVSAQALRAVPYAADSVVEDLEYHLMLVRSGRKVIFLDRGEVQGEMPDNSAAAATQRVRWEGGRTRMRRQFAPALARQVLRGRARLLEPLLDLLSLPVGTATLLLLAGLLLPVGFVREYARTGLLLLLLHVGVAAVMARSPLHLGRAAAAMPGHLWAKLSLFRAKRRAAKAAAAWVRTQRNRAS